MENSSTKNASSSITRSTNVISHRRRGGDVRHRTADGLQWRERDHRRSCASPWPVTRSERDIIPAHRARSSRRRRARRNEDAHGPSASCDCRRPSNPTDNCVGANTRRASRLLASARVARRRGCRGAAPRPKQFIAIAGRRRAQQRATPSSSGASSIWVTSASSTLAGTSTSTRSALPAVKRWPSAGSSPAKASETPARKAPGRRRGARSFRIRTVAGAVGAAHAAAADICRLHDRRECGSNDAVVPSTTKNASSMKFSDSSVTSRTRSRGNSCELRARHRTRPDRARFGRAPVMTASAISARRDAQCSLRPPHRSASHGSTPRRRKPPTRVFGSLGGKP